MHPSTPPSLFSQSLMGKYIGEGLELASALVVYRDVVGAEVRPKAEVSFSSS